MTMKVSVITVSYNSEKFIEETIQSVLNQNYCNIEYIIIDGESNDNTENIINKYRGYNIKIISEPDAGIYDAMNKGVKVSSGEYIYFLNCGDTFVSNDVITKVINELETKQADVLYGDIYNVYGGEKVCSDYSNLNLNFWGFAKGESICHQAIFANRKTFNNNTFDENFKICADKNWIIRCAENKNEFHYIDTIICNFDKSGISAVKENGVVIKKETQMILKQNYPFRYELIQKIKIFISWIPGI